MDSITALITQIFSLGIIAMQAGIAVLLYLYFFGQAGGARSAPQWVADRAMLFAFLVALGSMAASLYYSEFVGFLPCVLCWWQRVFLYPQVFIFGYALWTKREGNAVAEALLLSVFGAIIGAYQYYGQMFNASALPCPATPGAVSCAQIQFIEFGYITIPMMALTSFLLIIALMMIKRRV